VRFAISHKICLLQINIFGNDIAKVSSSLLTSHLKAEIVDGENKNNKISGFVDGNYYKNAVILYLSVKRILLLVAESIKRLRLRASDNMTEI
jgi:hypothetical protein